MSEFIKLDDIIIPKPNGIDYDLKPNTIYDLSNYYSPRLKENGSFNLPDKIYESEKDSKFRKLVIKRFNNNLSQVTGVLLAGEKGTGKTIQAKLIAKESGLPIINVTEELKREAMINFFKSFNTPVCVIFDEFDKYFESSDLISLLDGINKTTKMLILFTCNDLNEISDFLKDRCSRIRYVRRFTCKDNEIFITDIINDLGLTDSKDVLLTYCINNFTFPTIDNIKAFLTEYKLRLEDEPDLTPEDVAEYLNLTLK